MSATFFALLIAAASPDTTSEPVAAPAPAPVTAPAVVVVPGVAEAGWSVGAGASFGGATAIVERRITGPVWLGLNINAGLSTFDTTALRARPGSPDFNRDEQSSSWNAGADLRFRLQLAPDDAFLRPSIFLGAGVSGTSQTTAGTEGENGSEPADTSSEVLLTRARGDLGALLDFALLPWLAFRASSSFVNAGYQSQTIASKVEIEGEPTVTTSELGGGFFAGVQLQPAVSLQAFF